MVPLCDLSLSLFSDRLLESTTTLLPSHSHSALALLCSIGKIPHPMLEERTVALMRNIATTITECESTPYACMDVGEPRVTWRLATILRLGSFGQAAVKLMRSEEAMLEEMQSWDSEGLSALDLLSPLDSKEASTELAMGRCLATVELNTTTRAGRVMIAFEVLGALSLFPFHSIETAKNVWTQILAIEHFVSDSSPRPDTSQPRWDELRQFLHKEC